MYLLRKRFQAFFRTLFSPSACMKLRSSCLPQYSKRSCFNRLKYFSTWQVFGSPPLGNWSPNNTPRQALASHSLTVHNTSLSAIHYWTSHVYTRKNNLKIRKAALENLPTCVGEASKQALWMDKKIKTKKTQNSTQLWSISTFTACTISTRSQIAYVSINARCQKAKEKAHRPFYRSSFRKQNSPVSLAAHGVGRPSPAANWRPCLLIN